jgi:hypothetical protein
LALKFGILTQRISEAKMNRVCPKHLIIILVFSWMGIVCTATARTIYVDVNTPDNNDGSSWAKAYKYLQDALANVDSDPNIDEIRVAQGTYKPDCNSADPNGSNDRGASFQLKNNVSLKGGYVGFGAPDPNLRDPNSYETVLSGNIGDPNTDADNSYNIVYAANITALIEGFIITGGNGGEGSGLRIPIYSYTTLTIRHCKFLENISNAYGGGIYADPFDNYVTTIDNCSFIRNSALSGGGIQIGGWTTITNCDFFENSADIAGGGIYGGYGVKIYNCRFGKNKSLGQGSMFRGGGAIFTCENTIIVGCTFAGNISSSHGGSVSFVPLSGTQIASYLTNCTFSNNVWNSASEEIYLGTQMVVKVANCIFRNDNSNGRFFYVNSWCDLDIKFSNIQGGQSAIYVDPDPVYDNPGFSHYCWGNIDADPNFVNATGPDGIYGTEDDDLRLLPGSPCIDAGDNADVPADVNTDLAGNPRFFDDPNTIHATGSGKPPIVDMGAYEYIPNICGDTTHSYPVGDLDKNCRVDFYDFAIVAQHWLEDSVK